MSPVRPTPEQLPTALVDELRAAELSVEQLLADVERALAEDLPGPDVTSEATISAEARGVGVFAAREEGVVAGLGLAELVFRYVLGDAVTVTDRVADGTSVRPGDVVMTVAGPTRGLLTAERTALNYASHLSGIATTTARWVAALDGTGTRVLDTRKTLPGYRALAKYAVRCGGGVNHRFSLSDMALVKDNHVVAAGGVVPAYEAIRAAFPDVPVEVEVDRLDQLEELLERTDCGRIMLDNMTTDEMRTAVGIARRAPREVLLEASGGLTLDRAREVAETGVDFVSVGGLTHSVDVFDIGLDLREG